MNRDWLPLLFLCNIHVFGLTTSPISCARVFQDGSPEGVVKSFMQRMEDVHSDPYAIQELYSLLGPKTRQNLEMRAERAAKIQGMKMKPWDMFAQGQMNLHFRPKQFRTKIDGATAVVRVFGAETQDVGEIFCTREGSNWRIELSLPELDPLPKHRRD